MRLSSTLRLSPLLLSLALAACAGADATQELALAPAPTVSGPAAAARGAALPGAKKEWWQEGPMTKEKASSMC